MRRIFASVFVVVAIMGAGVLATGAYFQASTQVSNLTFTAGTTDIGLAECGPAPCALPAIDPAAQGTVTGIPAFTVGPGLDTTFCLEVAAEGPYPLTLTQTISGIDNGPLSAALHLTVSPATNECVATGDPALGDNTLNNWNNYVLTLKTNSAPTVPVYVLERLSWDAAANAGNQNGLQGQSLHLNATITGRTQ